MKYEYNKAKNFTVFERHLWKHLNKMVQDTVEEQVGKFSNPFFSMYFT